MRVRSTAAATALAATLLIGAASASADTLVTVGSQTAPFSGNKQNEPAVAIDPRDHNVVVAGANDNIDMEDCNVGPDTTCPFTDDVGVSGFYISHAGGADGSWTQPTYSGLTAQDCHGVAGTDTDKCPAHPGPIGTIPNYAENGLVSDGDPALAFGPAFHNGKPSYANGTRLYYANLTSKTTGSTAFKGFEAIAVSHIDDVGANYANQGAWSDPVIASKQNNVFFADKEQIWADNAESSDFFGNVYVCYAGFRSNSHGGQPLFALTSRDGGNTWTQKQLTAATNNTNSRNGFGRSGCTVRTDSVGRVYVFVTQFAGGTPGAGIIQMITSDDGGATWSRPRNLFVAYDTCGYIELSIQRCVLDGVAGARSDLSPAPSVDIANGAPSGAGATNRIVMTWVDGRDSPQAARVMYSQSTNRGGSFSGPVDVTQGNDRGYYSAPAISPDGGDVYLVYNAFTTPFRESAVGTGNDRQLVGVVLHADFGGAFTEIHRGASRDARGSSQNDLAAEFLGDYVYAAATNDYGTAVWNDVRRAVDCPAVDTYRQALHDEAVQTGQQTAEAEEPRGEMAKERDQGADEPTAEDLRPAPDQDCLAGFGNSDIFGGSFADPTP